MKGMFLRRIFQWRERTVQEQEHQTEREEREHPLDEWSGVDALENMNDEREERQGIQSELEDQPSPDQANEDADEMSREQTHGETARQQR